MSSVKKGQKGITRREFAKGAAGVAGVAAVGALASCVPLPAATPAAPTPAPQKWDREADVVVVGYGGAGAVAAITVAEQGASVLVIEKTPEIAMCNTFASSGHIGFPNGPLGAFPEMTVADFAKYFYDRGYGLIDMETCMGLASAWFEVPGWLEKHGIPLMPIERAKEMGVSGRYVYLGPEMVSIWSGKKVDGEIGTARELFAGYNRVVKQLGIEVMVNTPVKRLIQDAATKEILGVVAENGGKETLIKAKRAVIMACGGFEASRELMANYISECPVPIYTGGSPFNTGDGIKMAIDVGADLWHMHCVEFARDGMRPPEFPAAFWLDFKAWSLIVVNKAGKRFKDESVTYGHAKKSLEVFNLVSGAFPNTPNYYIFDEKTRLAGRIIMEERGPGRSSYSTYNMARELYHKADWSVDNSAEVAKGWIKQAATIAELATKTGVDPAGLETEVAKYNDYCAKGADPALFRPKANLVPIDKPPYYSVECVLNTINTQGGPKRNGKAQVLDTRGKPIPRLYSAGEFGSWNGQLYQQSNLGEGIASGLVSGRNAAAEKPLA